MKKIIIALICSVSLLQAQNYGKIRIYTQLNQPFMASLNGVRVNNQFGQQTSFNYLEDASYQLKVWFASAQYPINLSVNNTIGYENVYLLQKDQIGAYVVTLVSNTPLNNTQPEVTPNPTLTATPAETITAMSETDFSNRLSSVKREATDNGKFEKAEMAFASGYFTAAQVARVVRAFTFDDIRLKFAKLAYPRTLDKNNYYTVSDAFTFSQTKSDLAEFVKKNP